MEIAYSLENLEQVLASGLEQLLARHWQEVAFYRDIPLEPDWEAYGVVQTSERLRIFTARAAGELVGYCAYFVSRNPHYRSSLQAVQDVLFVAPEYRKTKIGARLILFAEGHLRAEGVQVTYQHSKVSAQLDMGPFLERLGYELIETNWAKRLDRS